MSITITSDNIANKVFAEETVVSTVMTSRDVYLHAISMCPETTAAIYIDNENVSNLCQPANQIKITDYLKAYPFEQGDGIVNKTTNAFCKVVSTANNIIYTDENYITLCVEQYDSKTAIPTYKPGDIIYQASYSPTFYTLVPPNPNPNSGPLYRNASVDSQWGWGSFMSSHAVWEQNGSAGSHSYVFPNVYFAAGSYTVTYAIDNTGTVKIGNATITETNASNNSWVTPKTYNFSVQTSGDYPVSWSCTNVGGPGGIAMVIKDSSGVVVFDTATAYTTQLTKEYHVSQSFQGRVENVTFYENNTKAYLTVRPEIGTLNIDPSAANDVSVIRRFSQTKSTLKPSYYYDNLQNITSDTDICKLQSTKQYLSGDNWPVGSVIQRIPSPESARQTILTSEQATISSYEHYSGLCAPTSVSGVKFYTLSKYIRTDNRSVDTLIVYNNSTGTTQTREITSVGSPNILTLSTAVTDVTSNSKYTVGRNNVDEYGTIASILTIPETYEKSFISGTRKITIVDADSSGPADSGYRMKASANYHSSESFAESYSTTPSIPVQQFSKRVPPPPRHDPVAQSFYVPSAYDLNTGTKLEPYGIYISSVDVWFAKKPYSSDSLLPVICRIVDVKGGFPTETVIAETHVEYSDVKVPVGNYFNLDLYTKFTFADPVYLPNDGQYAIIILSHSPDYYVMVSELGKTGLKESATSTKTPALSAIQPNVGSFFKSQNASTWTPIQDTDMVFRLNKCVFNASSGTVQFNTKTRGDDKFADAAVVYTSESNFKPTQTRYSIKTKNIANEDDISETYLAPNNLYDFGGDLKISSKDNKRRRWIVGGEKYSFNVAIHLSSADKSISPCISKESLKLITYTTIINDASISNNNISISSGGSHANLSNIVVTISSPDNSSGVGATARVYALNKPNSQGRSTINTIVLDGEGSGYYTTPQIRITETFDSGLIKSNTTTTLTATDKSWTPSQWVGYYVEIVGDSINAGSFVVGQDYIIQNPGTTDFNAIGASTNCRGIKFTATDSGVTRAENPGIAKLYTLKLITASTTDTLTVSGWDSGMPTILTNNSNTNKYTFRIVGANPAIAYISGETDAHGGNCETRYISKVVDLADGFDAGDLKVYLDCIRPRGTNVLVYYKVKSSVDLGNFEDKKWQLMTKSDDKFSTDQKSIIQLEFNAKVNQQKQLFYFQDKQSYPIGGSFSKFAIKIVLTAGDPTVTPVVINYAAIAVPAG